LAADRFQGTVAGTLFVAVGWEGKGAIREGDGMVLEGPCVVVGDGTAVLVQLPWGFVLVGRSPEVVVSEIT